MKKAQNKISTLLVLLLLIIVIGIFLYFFFLKGNVDKIEKDDSSSVKTLYLNNVDYEEMPSQKDE